jgi:hypothetical protein
MSLRKVAGLLAGFGLVAGLIGSGVGAVFTDQVTAQENINVGTFGCIISQTTAGTISGDQHSVVYNAPDITSSAPGSAPFTFTVKSTGSIPVKLQVTQTTPSAPFTSILSAPVADVILTQNGTHDYDAGLQWTDLGTANLGTSVSIVYSVSCVENSGGVGFGVGYYAVNNGGSQFAPGTWVRSTLPIASTAVVGGGTAAQSVSGGNLDLTISGGVSYADNGFYVPLGTLGSLSGYSATGTGSDFGTNLYFDVDKNGEFFVWTGNYLSGIGADAYGLGPTSAGGTLAVTGTSTFAMTCNATYQNVSLASLTAGFCSGIDATTPVAVWIGITSTGDALSTTITSAP